MMVGRAALPNPVQPNDEDLARLNRLFRKMMSEYDPAIREVLEHYPAYEPISRTAASPFSFGT